MRNNELLRVLSFNHAPCNDTLFRNTSLKIKFSFIRTVAKTAQTLTHDIDTILQTVDSVVAASPSSLTVNTNTSKV